MRPRLYRNEPTAPAPISIPASLETILISLGLFLLSLLAYAQIWGNDFVDYDDVEFITGNPHVREGLTARNITWAWTTFQSGLWIPLVWMSLQIDGSLSQSFGESTGLLPSIYHAQNLFWHISTTLLLFLTLKRTTARIWPSAFVAALFAVHPLHVESVAWATERKDVLSAFFWMLTVLAYVRYTEKQIPGRYVQVVISFVLGLLAKPMLVTLPCVLFLLDFWPLRRFGWKEDIATLPVSHYSKWWKIVVEKVPFFVLAIAGALLTVKAQSVGGSVASLSEISLPARMANAVTSYQWYLLKTFWPSGLAVFYVHPRDNWSWLAVLVSASLVTVVSIFAFATARRAPWFLVGWLWFLGTLVPVIGLMQVGAQARADRYVYIPHIGLFFAVVWSVGAILDKWRIGIRARTILGMSCLLALTIPTIIQVGYWRDRWTIWTHAMEVAGDNDRAHHELGRLFVAKYIDTKKPEYLNEALDHTREAVRLRPGNSDYQYVRGMSLLFRGERDEARDHFLKALRISPDNVDALHSLGLVEHLQKHDTDSVRELRRAVKLRPEAANIRILLGNVLWDMGQYEEAKTQWESALAINGNLPDALDGIGSFYLLHGNNADAARLFQSASELAPGNPLIWSHLGITYGRQKRWDLCINAHRRACDTIFTLIRPGPETSIYVRRLAFALTSSGRNSDALLLYTESKKMDPAWPSTNLEKAWNLATAPELIPGDALTAFELSSEVCQSTDKPSARELEVMAAALASTGQFEDAVATCRKALMQATPDQTASITSRIAIYEKKIRYTGQ